MCSPDKVSIYSLGPDVLFFQHHDDTIYPSLRLVHKCTHTHPPTHPPTQPHHHPLPPPITLTPSNLTPPPLVPQCFPTLQVDRGAIRFILDGAQLMCPGLTSPGAKLPPADQAVPAGRVVAINAEGKQNACMVGRTKMGTEEMKRINKGVGVETVHFLGDGVWGMKVE